MPRLVHIAPESASRAITRAGVRGRAARIVVTGDPIDLPRAVYAMPMMPSFWDTHQWLRELRANHDTRMVAVHLRIPSKEPVWVGRYNTAHERLPLGEAIRRVRESPTGNEILLERSVAKSEVIDVRVITQHVGWRSTPEATAWDCLCAACLPSGTPRLHARLRAFKKRMVEEVRDAPNEESLANVLGKLENIAERLPREPLPHAIRTLTRHPRVRIRMHVAALLELEPHDADDALLVSLLSDEDTTVRQIALRGLARRSGVRHALPHALAADEDLKLHFVRYMLFDVRPSATIEEALVALSADASEARRDAIEETRREREE